MVGGLTISQSSVSSFAALHLPNSNGTQLSQASRFSIRTFLTLFCCMVALTPSGLSLPVPFRHLSAAQIVSLSFPFVACNSFTYLSAKLLSAHTTLCFTFCLHFRYLCAFVDSGMAGRHPQRTINVRESMLADVTKGREDSLAAVMAADPYAYGALSCQDFRAKARQQWKDFREIILEKESVLTASRWLADALSPVPYTSRPTTTSCVTLSTCPNVCKATPRRTAQLPCLFHICHLGSARH